MTYITAVGAPVVDLVFVVVHAEDLKGLFANMSDGVVLALRLLRVRLQGTLAKALAAAHLAASLAFDTVDVLTAHQK